jgi:hypothetical protein
MLEQNGKIQMQATRLRTLADDWGAYLTSKISLALSQRTADYQDICGAIDSIRPGDSTPLSDEPLKLHMCPVHTKLFIPGLHRYQRGDKIRIGVELPVYVNHGRSGCLHSFQLPRLPRSPMFHLSLQCARYQGLQIVLWIR